VNGLFLQYMYVRVLQYAYKYLQQCDDAGLIGSIVFAVFTMHVYIRQLKKVMKLNETVFIILTIICANKISADYLKIFTHCFSQDY